MPDPIDHRRIETALVKWVRDNGGRVIGVTTKEAVRLPVEHTSDGREYLDLTALAKAIAADLSR
jgi:hypothetical protein